VRLKPSELVRASRSNPGIRTSGAGADALLLRPGLAAALKQAESAHCPLIVSRLDRRSKNSTGLAVRGWKSIDTPGYQCQSRTRMTARLRTRGCYAAQLGPNVDCKMTPVAFLCVALLVGGQLNAKECARLEPNAAEAVLDYLDSLYNVHLAYTRYTGWPEFSQAVCSRADSLARLFGTHWYVFAECAHSHTYCAWYLCR
jgi:hypothetical protein